MKKIIIFLIIIGLICGFVFQSIYYSSERIEQHILRPLIYAKANGVRKAVISKEEYICLMEYFNPPISWRSNRIWGIELIIK